MTSKKIITGIGLLLGTFLFSCSGVKTPAGQPPGAEYLPLRFGSGWERTPEVRVFVGDSLYEYIDGGAELYHMYKFIDVTVGDYAGDAGEIVADLYRFAGPEMAYGMYTTLRPEGPEAVPLGVEGFSAGPTLIFVKGDYLVNVIGYDEAAATVAAVKSLAGAIDSLLPGAADKPAMFSSFPQTTIIEHTEKMYAASFLGREYLSMIYTMDFIQDADTITLFLADDDSGGKFTRWSEQTGQNRTAAIPTADLPYDGGNAFIIADGYYGHIVAGLKNGKLAGIIGYKSEQAGFLTEWLHAIPQMEIRQ
jgi:hypothetical protein